MFKKITIFILLSTITIGTGSVAAQQGAYNSVLERALDDAQVLSSRNAPIDILDVTNADILEVLDLIAQKSDLLITADDDVTGAVTIFLKNISPLDALHIVLDITGLVSIEESGVFRVMTPESFQREFGRAFNAQIQSQSIPLVYSKAAGIIEILKQMKSEEGKIFFNEKANSLILMDSPENLQSMILLVKELDIPIETEVFELQFAKAPQVAEEVSKILTENVGRIQFDERSNNIVVTDTTLKIKEITALIRRLDRNPVDIYVDIKILEIALSDEHINGVDWEAIVAEFSRVNFDGTVLDAGVLTSEDFEVLLEALETVGETYSEFDYERKVFHNKPTDLNIDPEDNIELSFFTTVDSAQKLMVSISPKGQVKTTSLDMEDGSTIILGGLFKEKTIPATKKIPLLGDLPLLGFAFRNEGERLAKTEVMMFVTVHVVDPQKTSKK